jgi:hypothetical protein
MRDHVQQVVRDAIARHIVGGEKIIAVLEQHDHRIRSVPESLGRPAVVEIEGIAERARRGVRSDR